MDAPSTASLRSAVLTAPPPRFTEEDAAGVARRIFGVEGSASGLGSERDQNFRIDEATGNSFTLKVSNSGEDPAVLEMETAAILHVARVDAGLPVARPVPTVDGSFQTEIEGPDGGRHLVRLLTFLDGLDVEGVELPLDAMEGIGASVARMGRALRGFFHPAAGRALLWDLKNLPGLRPMLPHIEDTERRELITRILDRFDERALPSLPGLRAQVIHGDLSLGNVLVDGRGQVTGIVDFGDMTHTALVLDLVAALTSLMRGRSDPLETAELALKGYASVTRAEDEEAAILPDLILGRLATTVLVSAWRVRHYPENAEYITNWDENSWHLLGILEEMGFDEAARALRGMCETTRDGGSARRSSVASSSDDELLERRRRVLGGPLAELTYERPLHLVRGEGSRMFDADGRAFLDAYNNVPVVGHSHPRVVEAIARQARMLNTNTRYLHENVIELAERLTASMPAELDTCIFVNSGSEANDAAWRLATTVTGAGGAIVTRNSYHGVTAAIIDLSAEEWFQRERPAHVETIPRPDGYRGAYADVPDWGALAGEHLEAAIAVLGERGFRPAVVMLDTGYTSDGIFAPPPSYLQEIVRRTHDAGGLFVADEVQAGYGRTGAHLWSFQDSGVVPDIVTLGKPMGNGHPIAAAVMRRDIADRFARVQEFFSTFGGNPVACAAGLAVLDVLEEEDLTRNAAEVGAHLQAQLRALAGRHPLIGDVRGRGLLTGVELVRHRSKKEPAKREADEVMNGMRERGVLIGSSGPDFNVLKIRPPLVVSIADADLIVGTLDDTLASLGDLN
ncbi:MAG: aminotransferase class III-fold pyridoxal phosphate-dependent enzyme [Actinomycetota bacterium]|nr:aminotransferase class III-fold pyridoxal phosphate-dependent enzyme [Actinomycetota bacterium]